MSLEYAALFLLILVALAPIGFFAYQNLGAETRVGQARIAVQKIAAESDLVAAQGPGAKNIVDVFFPEGIDSNSSRTFVANKQVQLSLFSGTGNQDVFAFTKVNVGGTLPTSSGRHFLLVQMNQSGTVVVSAS